MKTIRTILIAISTLTAMLAFATSSNAATTTVKLHTDADTTRFLADSASGLASMDKTSTDDFAALAQDRHELRLRHVPERQDRALPHRPRPPGLPGRDRPRRA